MRELAQSMAKSATESATETQQSVSLTFTPAATTAAAATSTGTSGSSTSGARRPSAFGFIELWFQQGSMHPVLYWVFGCILAVLGPAAVL